MKKYLLIPLVFILGMIFFPGVAKAQYTSPYVYNNNAYLNYALASRRAGATRKGHSARKSKKRISSKSRRGYHRGRRISMVENTIKPELIILDLPRRNVIV